MTGGWCFALVVLCWLSSPTVAAAESWILWESVEEHRLHPVVSPFPSQVACVSRGQARIAEYRKQFKSTRPGTVVDTLDGGLTARVRWPVTTDPAADAASYANRLKSLLAMYEREVERQTTLATARQDLYERGALSEAELRQGERSLAAAKKDLDETRRAATAADERAAVASRQQPVTQWVGPVVLRYQCWPVGVNPQ